jgi:Arc/MetJ-type ribon-helix-helix transcriptional regulator
MPKQHYRSVSVNRELVDRVTQLINQIGTYHSVSEFVSEAVRLRIEALEKNIKGEKEAEASAASVSREGK